VNEGAAPPARSVLGSRLGYALLAVALPAALSPQLALPWVLCGNLLLGAAFAWDARRLARAQLALAREAPARVRAGQRAPYSLRLRQLSGPPLRVQLEEVAPPELAIEPVRHQTQLAPGAVAELRATLYAESHGRIAWSSVAVRKESALGLCARIEQLACPQTLRALPQVPLGRRALSALARREPSGSAERLRALGQGQELESLREYVATDSLRSIDWKATAKRRRPITRCYQPERSQSLWIVLDASRAMTLPLSEIEPDAAVRTRFDIALEAALRLADAALHAGDRVGLLIHGREALLTMPPRRGRAQLMRLLEGVLPVHAQATELDVSGLISLLGSLAKKRCLVVLFTDLDNEADLHLLAEHAPLLTRRHLTLCVSLEEKRLRHELRREPETEQDVYRKVAALSLHGQRAQLARELTRRGVPVIETDVRGLSGAALKRYREIKQSGRL
jgi:uncharacterized protein (DUF58 family)